MAKKWKSNGNKEVLNGEGFYISYNSNPGCGVSMFASDAGSETALCKDGDYFILNGDYRKEYEKLAPQGWDSCMEFYKEKAPEHSSSWSD